MIGAPDIVQDVAEPGWIDRVRPKLVLGAEQPQPCWLAVDGRLEALLQQPLELEQRAPFAAHAAAAQDVDDARLWNDGIVVPIVVVAGVVVDALLVDAHRVLEVAKPQLDAAAELLHEQLDGALEDLEQVLGGAKDIVGPPPDPLPQGGGREIELAACRV